MEIKPITTIKGKPYHAQIDVRSVPKPKLWQRRKFAPSWLFQAISADNHWLRWAVMYRLPDVRGEHYISGGKDEC